MVPFPRDLAFVALFVVDGRGGGGGGLSAELLFVETKSKSLILATGSRSREIYQSIELLHLSALMFSSLFPRLHLILSSPSLFYFLSSVNGSFIENTCEAARTSRRIKHRFPVPGPSLSYCSSTFIKQEGGRFPPSAHMDGNYQYPCTLLTPVPLSSPFFFFRCLLTLSHPPLVLVGFFACVELQKSKKVTKFCASFELFPFNLETKPRGDRVGSRLAPAASPVTNCVKQHHSATRRAE